MIGKLTGLYDSAQGNSVIVDVQGVGYVVGCSPRTLRQLPPVGESISLLIETQVREDAISLYGFHDALERDWFRLLITVQGVGARVAQAILGSLSPDDLVQAIGRQDKSLLTRADGVGPKLAARLITELKDKIGGLQTEIAAPHNLATAPAATGDHATADALSALLNLGYRRAEAFDALRRVQQDTPDATLDRLIPAALRLLGSQAA